MSHIAKKHKSGLLPGQWRREKSRIDRVVTDLCLAGWFQAQTCGAGRGTHQTILQNEWPYCEPWHSNVFKMLINIQSVKQLHSSLVHPSPGVSLVEYNLLQLSWMSYDKDGVQKRSWDIEVWWSTILFISTSANDLPSHSMLHIILSQAQEICIAANGLLFCSFTINCCCAACCNATLSADWAAVLALHLTVNSSSNFLAYTRLPITIATS